MIWNQDPEILNLGAISIRWYGLLFALGMYTGLRLTHSIKNKDKHLLFNIDTLLSYVVAGTVIGARLGHCFFYEPSVFLSDPLRVFFIWEGGLASHGALAGVVLSLYLFSRNHKVSFLKLCDLLAAPACLAGGMIRMGNFFNSEIIGDPTNLPWAITFLKIDDLPRHPTQLYEAFFYFLLCTLLVIYQNKRNKIIIGKVFGFYLVGTFSFRFFIEFLKIPQVNFEQNMFLNMGQILSIPLVLLGCYFIFNLHTKQKI